MIIPKKHLIMLQIALSHFSTFRFQVRSLLIPHLAFQSFRWYSQLSSFAMQVHLCNFEFTIQVFQLTTIPNFQYLDFFVMQQFSRSINFECQLFTASQL